MGNSLHFLLRYRTGSRRNEQEKKNQKNRISLNKQEKVNIHTAQGVLCRVRMFDQTLNHRSAASLLRLAGVSRPPRPGRGDPSGRRDSCSPCASILITFPGLVVECYLSPYRVTRGPTPLRVIGALPLAQKKKERQSS